MLPAGPQIPQKEPQVNVIGIDGALGATLDGQHIGKKVLQKLWTLAVVDVHAGTHGDVAIPPEFLSVMNAREFFNAMRLCQGWTSGRFFRMGYDGCGQVRK